MQAEIGLQSESGDKKKERKKRITSQYLFPLAGWVETDTLHALSPFFPEANWRALPLFGIGGLQGVAWEWADVA